MKHTIEKPYTCNTSWMYEGKTSSSSHVAWVKSVDLDEPGVAFHVFRRMVVTPPGTCATAVATNLSIEIMVELVHMRCGEQEAQATTRGLTSRCRHNTEGVMVLLYNETHYGALRRHTMKHTIDKPYTCNTSMFEGKTSCSSHVAWVKSVALDEPGVAFHVL